MQSCIVTHAAATSRITFDLDQVIRNMNANEQRKLYRSVALWIEEEDLQRALDFIADAIKESRAETAVLVSRGEWPVPAPLSRKLLDRFIDCMPKNVLSVCKIPTFIEDSKGDNNYV